MNRKVRLLRKPFTTILWLTLVTAMTVLLCVGGALWYSSESAAGIIDGLHYTVAYRTDMSFIETELKDGVERSYEPRTTSGADQRYLQELDSVEAVYDHTLTGGYSPRFTPIISPSSSGDINEGYDDVVFVATITQIVGKDVEEDKYDLTQVKLGGVESGVYLSLKVKVEEYLSVSEELCSVGTQWEAEEWDLFIDCLKESDAEYFEVGGRYLFSGHYFRYTTREPPIVRPKGKGFLDGSSIRGVSNLSYQRDIGEEVVLPEILTADIGEVFAARLEGTVEEFLSDPENAEWLRIIESREMAQHSVPIIATDSLDTFYPFANQKAVISEGRAFTDEEYGSGARVCMISLSLAEKSGIKLGDTIPISQFWCGGEDMHDEINQSTVLFSIDGRLNNPTIGTVGTATQLITRDEEFTVVGIYRQSSEWSKGSYDVTPNTVFIPKKAQIPGGFGGYAHSGTVTYVNAEGQEVTATRTSPEASWGIYQCIRLKNGAAEDFRDAIAGTALEGEFIITDQGYGEILGSIRSISDAARGLLALVGGGWALLLVLYLLLYQGTQRKNIGIMRSLGAEPAQAHRYLWGSGMTVAVIGVALGSAISAGIMGRIQQLLFEAATYTVALSRYSASGPTEQSFRELLSDSALPLWAIAAMGLAQISVFALTMYIQSRKLSWQEPRQLLGT